MGGPTNIDLGALNQRVTGVEAQLATISGQITTISTKLEERGRTQWPTLAAFASVIVVVMGALGALAYRPIDAGMARVERTLERMADAIVPRTEHAERWRQFETGIAKLEQRAERNSERIVSRGEHEEKWRGSDQRFADVQRQIDDLKRAQGETYSVRDVILKLEREIDRLKSGPPRP